MQAHKQIINQSDKSILLSPQKPLYSLIWLHGLGDTSSGFKNYFQLPQSPLNHGFRVKLLHAPIRAVTINNGRQIPSWYDIKVLSSQGAHLSQSERCNLDQVKQSMETLNKNVEEEAQFLRSQNVEGDVYKRIFVGGFSQGCSVSVPYGLTSKNLIGGVIGFSGQLFQSFGTANLGKVPILLNHGSNDKMITIQTAKKTYQKILNDQLVSLKIRPMGHEVNKQQLQEMTKWILSKVQNSVSSEL